MKRLHLLLSLVALATGPSAAAEKAWALFWNKDDTGAWKTAARVEIHPGDEVRTLTTQRADLLFGQALVLRVQPDSSVFLLGMGFDRRGATADCRLKRGSVLAKTSEPPATPVLRLRIPNAVIDSTQTVLSAEMTTSSTTRIAVWSGGARLHSLHPKNQWMLTSPTETRFQAASAHAEAQALSPEDPLQLWAEEPGARDLGKMADKAPENRTSPDSSEDATLESDEDGGTPTERRDREEREPGSGGEFYPKNETEIRS